MIVSESGLLKTVIYGSITFAENDIILFFLNFLVSVQGYGVCYNVFIHMCHCFTCACPVAHTLLSLTLLLHSPKEFIFFF